MTTITDLTVTLVVTTSYSTLYKMVSYTILTYHVNTNNAELSQKHFMDFLMAIFQKSVELIKNHILTDKYQKGQTTCYTLRNWTKDRGRNS